MTDQEVSPSPTPTPTPLDESTPEKEKGFFSSLRAVLTYRSYSVYLITSWILGIFGIILDSYMMLYFRQILVDFVAIGLLILFFTAIQLIMRIFGGYVGDNYNRKWLSVLTMAVSGLGFFILGTLPPFIGAIYIPFVGSVSTPLLWFMFGAFVTASSAIFASGSTSYIYENISPEHSGLAMGVFQTSVGFGLIGLALVTWLLGVGVSFVVTIQLLFLVGGFCYIAAALIRTAFLAPAKPILRKNRSANTFRDFFQQNGHAIRLLLVILPVFMGVLILDAISDGLYRFVSMFYLNEDLLFSYGEISLMLIVVLACSIPLSITVGGFFDRRGSRRAMVVIYAVMPICITLLILAPAFPYFLTPNVVDYLVGVSPVFRPLLSTAFIAMACKRINDILWGTLILTYLRRAIPRSETAKMLSIFFIVIMVANLFTPLPAAFTYTIFGATPVLLVSLLLNFVILAILLIGNIEPKPLPE